MADSPSQPYGDVAYADPGYQADKQKRYPLDSAEHVRAAWSYINMPKNAALYTAAQLREIKDRIEAAAKKYGVQIAPDDAEDRSRSQSDFGDFHRSANIVLDVASGNGRTLSGVALPYGVFTEVKDHMGHYQERILAGAFRDALSRKPQMLYQHGKDSRVGHTPIGSFERISDQSDGLHVEGQLFDNELTRPLIDAARAGELAQWSVHFRTRVGSTDDTWTREKGWDLRTVSYARQLPEISLVNFGAYPTTVSVRSSLDELSVRPEAAGQGDGSPDDAEPRNGPPSSDQRDKEQRARLWALRRIYLG